MSEEMYYYRERMQQLESELMQAHKTIDKLNKRLNDIRMAIMSRNVQSRDDALGTIAWIAYDWKD